MLAAVGAARRGFSFRVDPRKHLPLAVALVALTLFAITHEIGFGASSVTLARVPDSLLSLASPFRASGRFFWPAFYLLLLGGIAMVVRAYPAPVAAAFLGLALVAQVLDTHAGWQPIKQQQLAVEPHPAWVTPLRAPFWKHAAERYDKLRLLMPRNQAPRWSALAYYAARHQMATDAVQLARVGVREMQIARENAERALARGVYESDTLYILDAPSAERAAASLDPERDLLVLINDFTVLAPGWKLCATCPPLESVREKRVSHEHLPTSLR